MSKFRVDRFRVIWLTLITGLLSGIMLFLNPAQQGSTRLGFAKSFLEASAILAYPGSTSDFYLCRASRIADCLFLFAYGALLCVTIQSRLRLRFFVTGAARARVDQLADNAFMFTFFLLFFNLAEDVASLVLLAYMPQANSAAGTVPRWVPFLFVAMRWAARFRFLCAAGVLVCLSSLWLPVNKNARRRERSRFAALVFAAAAAFCVVIVLLSFFPNSPGVGVLGLVVLFLAAFGIFTQLCLWGSLGLCARIAYLCRVPLMVLTILAALGPIALGPAASMLQAILIFDPLTTITFAKQATGPGQLGIVFAIALFISFACIAQISLILQYGAERVNDSSLRALFGDNTRMWVRGSALAAALVLVISADFASFAPLIFTHPGKALLSLTGSLIGGGFLAFFGLYLSELIQALLTSPTVALPQLILPTSAWPDDFGKRIRDWHQIELPFAAKIHARADALTRFLFRKNRGYCDSAHHIYPGHVYALCLSLVSGAGYISLLFFNSPFWGDPRALIPALASVLLVLLVASWLLAGLAFMLDRYRVPLISAIVVLFLLLGLMPVSDFVFNIGDASGETYIVKTPAQVLATRGEDPVLVAAAGGGIQAAVWTTRVLAGLDAKTNGRFRQRLALISSVSGGSIGALYAGSYFADKDGWTTAYQKAQLSSLDEVAWALVGPDLFHPLVSLAGFRTFDRGSTLERMLEKRMKTPESVKEWANRTGAAFPAFLFNSTIAETGEPVAFATTQMPSAPYLNSLQSSISSSPVVQSAARRFRLNVEAGDAVRGSGLSVATAARLSASFPYVSPAARPDWSVDSSHPGFHMVDGGYYDNYGLVALSQWLDDALENGATNPKRISIVIIRGPADEANPGTENWSWSRQITAPVTAFLGVRNQAQWSGGSATLNLLMQKWAGRVQIQPYVFEYPDLRQIEPRCAQPPLSWKLTSAQIACVEDAWNFEAQHGPVSARFLSAPAP